MMLLTRVLSRTYLEGLAEAILSDADRRRVYIQWGNRPGQNTHRYGIRPSALLVSPSIYLATEARSFVLENVLRFSNPNAPVV